MAGLTAVDGATLITDSYELLAFGVKIFRPDGRPRVEQVVVTEPVEGGAAVVMAPVQLGGTRHISAAQFAQDQQDAVALVASQDGHFTIFVWSPARGHGPRPPRGIAAALRCPIRTSCGSQMHPVLVGDLRLRRPGRLHGGIRAALRGRRNLPRLGDEVPLRSELSFSGPVMPTPFIYGLAALFVVSGLLLWSVGLRATIGRLRFEGRARRRHADEPWLGDRAWNPKGDRERPVSSRRSRASSSPPFSILFLVPFNWWMCARPLDPRDRDGRLLRPAPSRATSPTGSTRWAAR